MGKDTRFCPRCGEESEELYNVSPQHGELCGNCAEKAIEYEKWQNLDMKILFELENKLEDKELIDRKLSWVRIYYCQKCAYMDFEDHKECPGCRCEWDILNSIDLDKEHIRKLTRFVSPNLHALLEGIANAKHFINIATQGIDPFFTGVLSVKCLEYFKVNVVVMNPGSFLKKFVDSIYEAEDKIRCNPESHTKLIVIDGILAFKGSANATFGGWTRSSWEELREIVTRPVDVQKLNNEYFARSFRFSRPILKNSGI